MDRKESISSIYGNVNFSHPENNVQISWKSTSPRSYAFIKKEFKANKKLKPTMGKIFKNFATLEVDSHNPSKDDLISWWLEQAKSTENEPISSLMDCDQLARKVPNKSHKSSLSNDILAFAEGIAKGGNPEEPHLGSKTSPPANRLISPARVPTSTPRRHRSPRVASGRSSDWGDDDFFDDSILAAATQIEQHLFTVPAPAADSSTSSSTASNSDATTHPPSRDREEAEDTPTQLVVRQDLWNSSLNDDILSQAVDRFIEPEPPPPLDPPQTQSTGDDFLSPKKFYSRSRPSQTALRILPAENTVKPAPLPPPGEVPSSMPRCSPEEIELKRKLALERRKQRGVNT